MAIARYAEAAFGYGIDAIAVRQGGGIMILGTGGTGCFNHVLRSLGRPAVRNDEWPSLLHDAEAGVEGAKERLFAALYAELHRLAERQLQRNASASISPTTLLHESYLAMARGEAVFPDRARFMGYASQVMRGLIVDFARQRRAQKRGADFHITRLDTRLSEQHAEPDSEELLRLSEAIDALAVRDPRLAELVDLKYFCGFSLAEIAALRDVSERTVRRDWEKARLLLYSYLKK